ncbi:reverse transcriptase domain-containing protein [Tanacetum coccineum]
MDNNLMNQVVQAMPSSEQLSVVNHSETKITSDSNIIPYSHVNDTLTAELERYKEQVKVLKEGQNVDLKKKESLMQTITLLKNDFKKEESRNIDREIFFYDHTTKQALRFQNPFYLKKAQQLEPKLYDGNVIKNTSAIVIPDSEETLMLAEESRSKMLLKQQDPMVLEKKNSMNSSDPSPSCRPTKVEVPKELPKVSMVNTSDAVFLSVVNHSETEITSNSNIIPYSQYVKESQQAAVQNSNSSAQQDALILSVIEQLKTQVINCTKINLDNKSVNDTLTAELEKYKEQVKVLKEGQNVDLKNPVLLVDLLKLRSPKKFLKQHETILKHLLFVCYSTIVKIIACSILEHVNKWTKDHPLDNIIGDLGRPVFTKSPSPVYVSQPDGFVDKDNPNHVDKLRRLIWVVTSSLRCDLVDTPMVEKSKLDDDTQGKVIDPTHYHGMAKPTEKHLHAIKRILYYLRGTVNMGLWYPKDSSIALTAYANADHAGCQDIRRSTSGSMQLLGDRLVSWSSKR